MLKIKNNPIDILFEVVEENYPQITKKISTIGFALIEKAFGVTQFNDDGSIEIYISIYKKRKQKMDFETATELLAHELAHAISGIEAEHNEEWERVFDELNKLYYERIEKDQQCLKV